MKKSPIIPALLLFLLAAAYPGHSGAQLFKQLLNTVKNTAQNRANDKASQTTNKALDKADGATQIKSNAGTPASSTGPGTASMPGDTAATNRVLGAIVKAAAANPNDTSGSDVAMKALSIMAGGAGVSASDSAAAIKSFMTASGGSGLHYQYQTSATTKRGIGRDTSDSYITVSGNARSEVRINSPGAMSVTIISIGHAAQRQYSVLLDPDDRTYSLNVMDTALINSGGGEIFQVTRIGSETVQGYSCVHSKVTTTQGSGAFKSNTIMDIWTSTAVPGYSLIKRLSPGQHVKANMMAALDNQGAGGFLVKMVSGGKEHTVTMLLTRAEEKSFPASLFEIPPGYSQSGETIMGRMLSAAKPK